MWPHASNRVVRRVPQVCCRRLPVRCLVSWWVPSSYVMPNTGARVAMHTTLPHPQGPVGLGGSIWLALFTMRIPFEVLNG